MLFILYFKIFHTATSVHERLFFHARREIFTFSVLIVKLRTISSFPAFSRVISLSFIFSYQISRYIYFYSAGAGFVDVDLSATKSFDQSVFLSRSVKIAIKI